MGYPVIPSHLGKESSSFADFTNNNYSLKIGAVINVTIPTGDPAQPPFPQYTVMVEDRVNGAPVTVPYKNCMLMDLFGSIPDFFEFSLRKSSYTVSQFQELKPPKKDTLLGATVLIASINGETQRSIIIGALRVNNSNHPSQDYEPPTKATDKYLNFNFNGINCKINDDGEFSLIRNGPQANDGTTNLQDAKGTKYKENNKGSFININKNGDVNISAGGNETGKDGSNTFSPNILLEKNGTITIVTGKSKDTSKPSNAIEIKPDGSINITINKGLNLQLIDNGSNATLTLGNGAVSVAIADNLKTYINDLVQQIGVTISSASSTPGGGPLVLPLQPSAWPQWDESIASQSMTVPK